MGQLYFLLLKNQKYWLLLLRSMCCGCMLRSLLSLVVSDTGSFSLFLRFMKLATTWFACFAWSEFSLFSCYCRFGVCRVSSSFCSNPFFVCSVVCLFAGWRTETVPIEGFKGIVFISAPSTVFFMIIHLRYSFHRSARELISGPLFAVTHILTGVSRIKFRRNRGVGHEQL